MCSVIFECVKEETVTSSGSMFHCKYKLYVSSFPELHSDLRWFARKILDDSSTFFFMVFRRPVFTVIMKATVRELNCPQQASLGLHPMYQISVLPVQNAAVGRFKHRKWEPWYFLLPVHQFTNGAAVKAFSVHLEDSHGGISHWKQVCAHHLLSS